MVMVIETVVVDGNSPCGRDDDHSEECSNKGVVVSFSSNAVMPLMMVMMVLQVGVNSC